MVHAPSRALAVRSAAIVARGLRDLARDSNWLIKKVFNGHSPHLAISPTGQLCAVSPLVRQGTERIALYDVELSTPTLALAVPGEPEVCSPGLPAAFRWSPTARYLIAAWGAWPPELHIFDLHRKSSLGAFGRFSAFPNSLAWSDTGRYFAAASKGGTDAQLRLWEAEPESTEKAPFGGTPLSELGGPRSVDEWMGSQAADSESGDDGAFSGFGCNAFSPDEETLASVIEIEGDWADDSIVLLEVPTLRRQSVFHAQGHVTDLGWTFDSRQLIYCSAGQAYRLAAGSEEAESLPFGAELCACHPHLPLCLCFSSWLRNSAKGRLFLVDLNRLAVFDEYAAEGVVNLRWSLDGSKAYAVTADGLAYIYEPPLL
ncbi:MAG TPA: WD40 repeat domain-containing protein [Candidatus Acidoferrales bacterium]|nr:WD40 repeat domain-containing protein [Candidatus Acidoferrales bacterium]